MVAGSPEGEDEKSRRGRLRPRLDLCPYKRWAGDSGIVRLCVLWRSLQFCLTLPREDGNLDERNETWNSDDNAEHIGWSGSQPEGAGKRPHYSCCGAHEFDADKHRNGGGTKDAREGYGVF